MNAIGWILFFALTACWLETIIRFSMRIRSRDALIKQREHQLELIGIELQTVRIDLWGHRLPTARVNRALDTAQRLAKERTPKAD
jgi:hypothetical protein